MSASLIIWCFKDSTHFDILHLLKHLSFRCDSPAQKLGRYLAVLFGDGELWEVLKFLNSPGFQVWSYHPSGHQSCNTQFWSLLVFWLIGYLMTKHSFLLRILITAWLLELNLKLSFHVWDISRIKKVISVLTKKVTWIWLFCFYCEDVTVWRRQDRPWTPGVSKWSNIQNHHFFLEAKVSSNL